MLHNTRLTNTIQLLSFKRWREIKSQKIANSEQWRVIHGCQQNDKTFLSAQHTHRKREKSKKVTDKLKASRDLHCQKTQSFCLPSN